MLIQQFILHSTKASIRPRSHLLARTANFSTTSIKMTGLTGMFSNRYHFDDIPDQRNKVAIVTGGSAGIGSSIAMGLAIAGADVHIVSTTPEHGEETASQINSEVQKCSTASPKFPSGHCTYHQLDLGDLNAVKAFGEKVLKEFAIKTEQEGVPEQGLGNPGREQGSKRGGLNYLINNAGIGVAKFDYTKDGLANHFAVNHLAHMLLINTLLPLLEETRALPGNKTGDVRIVNMASEQHRLLMKDVEFKTLEEVQTDVGGNNNYARSKLMNILYTKELGRRVLSPKGNQILAIATHPGVVSTGQQRAAEEPYGILGTALTAVARIAFMSPDQGAESSLWAATASKVAESPEKYQGAYLRQPDDDLGSETDQAKDPKLAANLWEMSKQVIKDKTGVEISA